MNGDTQSVIALMNQKYARDLSVYDPAFLQRSLKRRQLAVCVDSLAEYCHYIQENENEAEILSNSLHINYSQFFREPLTFALLEQQILPGILSKKTDGSEIRIWSAGCAGGQEAYSLAMLLLELSEMYKKEIGLRIFATDISPSALKTASAGIYDFNSIQNVRMKYFNKYFSTWGESFAVLPQLKQHISFIEYDLLDRATANPPESIFGDFDVVMCSNLLLYYQLKSQQFILQKLRKAMSESGYLIIGETERNILGTSSHLNMLETSTSIFYRSKGSEIR